MPRKSGKSSRREADLKRLERAAEFYLNDCYEARTAARADEFADYLRRTRPYLSRVALDLTGDSLSNYLRAKQLARAKKLLQTMPASVSIDQIALACAFGTPWTFHRCFKVAFGMTPGAYRKKVTK